MRSANCNRARRIAGNRSEESSLDAWFEGDAFYRTPQRSISYYNKGEVVGVLLDLRIRQLTGGRKSLRDLFQWMNQNYAKKGLPSRIRPASRKRRKPSPGRALPTSSRTTLPGCASCPTTSIFQFVGLQVAQTMARYSTAGFHDLDQPWRPT